MNKIDVAMERIEKLGVVFDSDDIERILTDVFGEQPVPQDVKKEIQGVLRGWKLTSQDVIDYFDDAGSFVGELTDDAINRLLAFISPYLAVNDRRALVRLKEEMKGRYNKIYDHVGYASREEELEKWLNRIDALLAELPEPVKPFDVDALEDWVRKTTNGKNTRLIESDPPQQEFIYRQHILDKIAKLKGKS